MMNAMGTLVTYTVYCYGFLASGNMETVACAPVKDWESVERLKKEWSEGHGHPRFLIKKVTEEYIREG